MKYYTQIDTEYCNEELVPGVTIKDYGCYFCCICTLAQVHPLELLKLCKEDGRCFTDEGLLYSGRVGALAGIPYVGVFAEEPEGIHIVKLESRYNNNTHFVISLNNNKYWDPLAGQMKVFDFMVKYADKYTPSDFRLFHGVKEDWITTTRREGMELGITNGERMEEPMIRAEGVKMCLNLLKKLNESK